MEGRKRGRGEFTSAVYYYGTKPNKNVLLTFYTFVRFHFIFLFCLFVFFVWVDYYYCYHLLIVSFA